MMTRTRSGVWVLALMALASTGLFGAGGCEREIVCNCGCRGYYDKEGASNLSQMVDIQNEAKRNLQAIFSCQVAYYGEYSTYARSFNELGWQPEQPSLYSYFLAGDSIHSIMTVPYHLPPTIVSTIGSNNLIIVAVGNIDNDATLDIWTVNEQRFFSNIVDDMVQ